MDNSPTVYIVFLFILMSCLSCTPGSRQAEDKKNDPPLLHLGQNLPGNTPRIYGQEYISTRRHERDFAKSNDGKEIFYSYALPGFNFTVVLTSKFTTGQWTRPTVASFSGSYHDLEPAFSPDGQSLLFISKRPVSDTDSTDDWNIWRILRQEDGWSEPHLVQFPFDTKGNEYYPSQAKNGNLYFTASLDDSYGGEDIYVSVFHDGEYSEPVNLGENINSTMPEFNAFISPDERIILFSSYGREDGIGGGDLYISYKPEEGKEWTPAVNLGQGINSDKMDYCPYVDFDQELLFFTSERLNPGLADKKKRTLDEIQAMDDQISNGLGDIYWVNFKADKWQK